jgi:hypothetical protein
MRPGLTAGALGPSTVSLNTNKSSSSPEVVKVAQVCLGSAHGLVPIIYSNYLKKSLKFSQKTVSGFPGLATLELHGLDGKDLKRHQGHSIVLHHTEP